mgnify:CR=1 FL=1
MIDGANSTIMPVVFLSRPMSSSTAPQYTHTASITLPIAATTFCQAMRCIPQARSKR